MPRFRVDRRSWLAFASLLAVGCTAPVVDDAGRANVGMTQGAVVIERAETSEGAETSVSAKFMRVTAVDPELAERLVTGRLEVPEPGVCTPLNTAQDDAAIDASGRASIELLDVGDLTLQAGSSGMLPLAARAFPDVGELVSGVFYVSADPDVDLPTGETVRLESTGSPSFEGFSFTTSSPSTPDDVRLGDDLLTEGASLEAGAPARVTWLAPTEVTKAQRGGTHDRIVVDVTSPSGVTTRCGFADVGEGVLPGNLFSDKALGGLPSVPTIELHRIRTANFGAPGIDVGEVRFDHSVKGHAIVVGAAPAD